MVTVLGIKEIQHSIESLVRELRRLIGLLEHRQNPVRFWTITIGQDEPIQKVNMLVTLTKPLAPGFRRALTITPDEAVDQRADGSFCQATTTSGDSTGTVDPSSTATAIKAFINGDGSLGNKVVTFACDGHIGDGDVEITVDVAYVVASPDATTLNVVESGTPDEKIP